MQPGHRPIGSGYRRSTLLSIAAVVVCTVPALATRPEAEGADRPVAKVKASDDHGTEDVRPPSAIGPGADSLEPAVRIRADAEVHRIIVTTGPEGRTVKQTGRVSGEEPRCEDDPNAGYCNTLGFRIRGPGGTTPNRRWSDDIVLAVDEADGLTLDRFLFRVTGDRRQDGSGTALGTYTVTYALYETCPGANAVPQVISGTEGQVTISTNIGGITEIVHNALDTVTLPTNELFVGVSFDRMECGFVVGVPATKGFSADRLDLPGAACNGGFGGFPGDPHASFYFELYVRDDPPPTFIGYRNTNHARLPYSPGLAIQGWRFAEDITLGVPQCNLIAYEFAFKDAIVGSDLRRGLENDNPENGQMIEGTDCFAIHTGASVEIARCELPEPVLLTEQSTLWVAYRTNSFSNGPVKTCKNALVGETSNIWMVYDPGQGQWVPEEGHSNCWGGFDVTLYCEGPPPKGACCDMYMRECAGGGDDGRHCEASTDCAEPGTCESVCRQLPEINCSSWWDDKPLLWASGGHCGPVCLDSPNAGDSCVADADCTLCVEGARDDLTCCPGGDAFCNPTDGLCAGGERDGQECCPGGSCQSGTCAGSFCVGGSREGQPCTRAVDCPDGACEGSPFGRGRACGLAACCKPFDPDDPNRPDCADLTLNQCDNVEPIDGHRWHSPGMFCGVEGQQCPFPACLVRTGVCTRARPEPGCWDYFCCQDVCEVDTWCCKVEWDELCVRWARELCPYDLPHNDDCHSYRPEEGAQLLSVPDSVEGDSIRATEDDDPGFCCHAQDPGANAYATVWYRFIATDTSARLSTCGSTATSIGDVTYLAEDSLLAVFAVGEPDRGACRDSMPCSVSENNCDDGFECEFDEQYACANLSVVACNDDDETCDPYGSGDLHPGRSTLCVTDLIPGDLYYVMVGAKTDEPDPHDPDLFHALGVYRLDIESPCTPPGPVNDRCDRADAIGEGVTPFDLAGATLDCPVPPRACVRALRNDIWYEWTAPCAAHATIETCGEDDASTPDTGLIVYRGCECPPLENQIVACSESRPPPCSGGSKVTIDVEPGECYKLRVGGDNGATPSGDLTITAPCTCASGPVTFVDPPDGVVDARQPNPPGFPFPALGIRSITVQAPDGAGDPSCWTLCDTSDGAPPEIVQIVDMFDTDGTYTLAARGETTIRQDWRC